MQALAYREGLKNYHDQLREFGEFHSPEDYYLSKGRVSETEVREKTRLSVRGGRQLEKAAGYILRMDSFTKARRLADRMSARLDEIGRSDLAEKVAACFKTGRLLVYEQGREFEPGAACGYSKLCPFHARIESKRRLTKYLDAVVEVAGRSRIQFGTLTVANASLGEYAQAAAALWAAWGKLRRLDVWKPVKAAMVNMETTWGDNGFNLHLHVLVAVQWRQNFDWGRVREAWHRLTGAEWIYFEPVNVQGLGLIYALKELVKYPAKFEGGKLYPTSPVDMDIQAGGGLLDMPLEAFREWFLYNHGKRTMRTYGEWYNVPDQDEEPPELGVLLGEFRWTSNSEGVDVFLIRVHNLAKLQQWAEDNLPRRKKSNPLEPP